MPCGTVGHLFARPMTAAAAAVVLFDRAPARTSGPSPIAVGPT